MGRLHYHYGYVSGDDVNGDSFDYDTDEIRRMRIGAKAEVLNYFDFKGQAEVYDDRSPIGGASGFEFTRMWDLYGRFDAADALDISSLDTFKFGYGRRETHTSGEWHTSSNKLKTVERSAISNKVWPYDRLFSNPTGAWVQVERGAWDVETGIFSTSTDQVMAPWDDGEMYWLNATYDFKEATGADISNIYFAGFYQDAELGQERLAGGVEWSTSAHPELRSRAVAGPPRRDLRQERRPVERRERGQLLGCGVPTQLLVDRGPPRTRRALPIPGFRGGGRDPVSTAAMSAGPAPWRPRQG